MTQKGVEKELKRCFEAKELAEYQNYQECLQTGGMGYPPATLHIPNPLEKTMKELEKELNQNFSLSDKVINLIPKKKRKNNNYSPIKVKARNFLTNVSYNN